jgi:plasmid stabilization system protein ParE
VNVRIGGPASEELGEAVRWYEDQSEGLGAAFLQAVHQVVSRIETHPEIGAKIPDLLHTRRVLVPGFPYQLVYIVRPTEVIVAAVAHLKRRPGYWRRRM